MFFSSISLSPIAASPSNRGFGAPLSARRRLQQLPQTLGREIRDRLVILGRHETRAGVDVDRREAVDDLLTEAQNRQIALLERLLVGSQLHPAALERLDDLRAGVEADIEDLARLLACSLHVGGGVSELLAS